MRTDARLDAVLAGFRVESLIGQGAMGAVYLAEDTKTGQRVALKLLGPELTEDDRFRQRFMREAEIAASLDHPHIVPTLTFGEENGRLGRDVDHIARCPRLQPRVLAERLAELGNLAVHLRRRRNGCAPRIELIRQPVDRDDPVCVEEQDRERRSLLWPAERKRPCVPDDLERPQDPELEHRRTVAAR